MLNAFVILALSRDLLVNVYYHRQTSDVSLLPSSLSEGGAQQVRGAGRYLSTRRAINRSRTTVPVRVKTAIIRIGGSAAEKTAKIALVRLFEKRIHTLHKILVG